MHAHTIVVAATTASRPASRGIARNDRPRGGNDRPLGCRAVSPTWIWLQAAIIVFVLIGMVVAITKLA
jgi:hypothetical protein